MTAEVALLNKHGVALAADSAVTITGESGNKIYNAANKLFALSKYEPICVMIYGNAELMGVPWETIIKSYRQELGSKGFPKAVDYYNHFLAFLGTSDAFFGDDVQREGFARVAVRIFSRIQHRVRLSVDALLKAGRELDPQELPTLISQTINAELQPLAGAKYAVGMNQEFEARIADEHSELLDGMLQLVFEDLPLTDDDRQLLRKGVVFAHTRDRTLPASSGVVVAGFGRDEHFPALYSATVETRIGNRLKFQNEKISEINHENVAQVVPFAQTDGVELFLTGIDPFHATFATRLAMSTMRELKDAILESLALPEEKLQSVAVECEKLTDEHWRSFSEQARNKRQENYVDPLLSVIEMLPKDELAAAAEALVNLTSLRRKMSMEAETVGGPIDVAVISKGDGLVWIQRKHYFRPELNPHFFANYFQNPSERGA